MSDALEPSTSQVISEAVNWKLKLYFLKGVQSVSEGVYSAEMLARVSAIDICGYESSKHADCLISNRKLRMLVEVRNGGGVTGNVCLV